MTIVAGSFHHITHLIDKKVFKKCYRRIYSRFKARENSAKWKSLGLCIRCGGKREENFLSCKKCLSYVYDKKREWAKNNADRYKRYFSEAVKMRRAAGLCTRCGCPLTNDIDRNKTTCYNCRRRVYMVYC